MSFESKPFFLIFGAVVFHIANQSPLNQVISSGTNIGITSTDETHAQALWILKNWTYLTYTSTNIASPVFNFTNEGLTFRFNIHWIISTSTSGTKTKQLELKFFHLANSDYATVKMRVQFFFLSFTGKAILSGESTKFDQGEMHQLTRGKFIDWNNFYLVEKLEGLFPISKYPNLPILINVWYFSKTTETVNPDLADLQSSLSLYEKQTFSDFGTKLLTDKASMDILIMLPTGNRSVHSTILKSRSPGTYRKFISNFPITTQIVKVNDDISLDQLDQIIKFIYTDETPRFTSPAQWKKLISAAAFLNVTDLQDVCVQHLRTHVNLNNALDWYIFAKCNNITKLVNYINTFWKVNANIMTTDQWQQTLDKISNVNC